MRSHAVCSLFFLLLSGLESNGQQIILKPDQNPRYGESNLYYRDSPESLPTTEDVTLQQKYKAYDWYGARLERRQQRQRRHMQKYSHHRLIYYHRFFHHLNRDAPFEWRFSRHRFFRNSLPCHP